jgi:hypothetical protein
MTARRNICRWNGVAHRGALWGGQICIQNSNFIEVDANYLECGPDLRSPWGSGQAVFAINQNERVWDEGVFGGDFGVREIKVHNNLIVMPFRGHSGIDYGTLRWDTYQDFLDAGLVWRDNRYLAAQPLDTRWSWRLEDRWNETVAQWLNWDNWRTHQDAGSTMETIGPDRFQPHGTEQWPLITQATGHDYPALKAALTRRPPASADDTDADGLADAWERQFFPGLGAAAGTDDPDADGWTNARELAEQTHPRQADTDADGLPDAWEHAHGLNPVVFDSGTDGDMDGRSAREEFEDGTDPTVAEAPDQPVPEQALSLWLETDSGLVTHPDGTPERWTERSRHRRPIAWTGAPSAIATAPTGRRLVHPGDFVACPGDPAFWGTGASGFTMVFVYQPIAVELTESWRAVLTNETYLHAGFRLRLENGYLVLSSGQGAGTLRLAGHTRLEPGRTYIVSVHYSAPGGRHALYLDGAAEAWTPTGSIVPSSSPLLLGATTGVVSQPARFGDVVVFNRALSHRERRTVERLLRSKFLTGAPAVADIDLDGLPDAYELAHQLDPSTPDALGDDDGDGASNLVEMTKGTNPQISDTDADGMSDGWEIAHGLDPLLTDAASDPDGDGGTNLMEFEEDTDPHIVEPLPAALDFPGLRVWWRSHPGLETAGGRVTRWADSSTRNNPGVPAGLGPIVSATPAADLPTVETSGTASLETGPVDFQTSTRPPGTTLIAVVRPPPPGPAGAFEPLLTAAGATLGAVEGRIAVRYAVDTSTLAAAAPLVPGIRIVTLTLAPPPARTRLFVDGRLVAEGAPHPPVPDAPLRLGGFDPGWNAAVGEVAAFAGLLSRGHRVVWENMLAGKWQQSGPIAGDTDGDGLPDWWEWEASSDPTSDDALADADLDGLANLAAFQQGRSGFVWTDGDHDGMHDGWEVSHGLNPQVDDSMLDPDADSFPNGLEHALATNPAVPNDAPDAWAIALDGDTPARRIQLRFRQNHRSWNHRLTPEESTDLSIASWNRLAVPDIVVPPIDGVSRINLTPNAPRRQAHFRLRLGTD